MRSQGRALGYHIVPFQGENQNAAYLLTRPLHMPERSPILFWLLLAATLSVDAVAVVWVRESQFSNPSGVLFLALAFSQLSLISVWCVSRRRTAGWRWLVPFAAGAVVAAWPVVVPVSPPAEPIGETMLAFAAMFWIHTAFAIAGLWLAMLTRLIQKADDTVEQRVWQFSVKNLLVVTTASAILLALLRKSELLTSDFASLATFIIGNALLLIIVLRVYTANWRAHIRLPAALAAAVVIGAGAALTNTESDSIWLPFYLIQSIMLMFWFELSRIAVLDPPAVADSDELKKTGSKTEAV